MILYDTYHIIGKTRINQSTPRFLGGVECKPAPKTTEKVDFRHPHNKHPGHKRARGGVVIYIRLFPIDDDQIYSFIHQDTPRPLPTHHMRKRTHLRTHAHKYVFIYETVQKFHSQRGYSNHHQSLMVKVTRLLRETKHPYFAVDVRGAHNLTRRDRPDQGLLARQILHIKHTLAPWSGNNSRKTSLHRAPPFCGQKKSRGARAQSSLAKKLNLILGQKKVQK